MAQISSPTIRLLGFAAAAGLGPLCAAMEAVRGPALRTVHGPAIAAIFQAEPANFTARGGRRAMLLGLHTTQKRLEVACQRGAFLPADPAHACLPARGAETLLEPVWEEAAEALTRFGLTHQWDVILSWEPEPILAAARQSLAPIARTEGPAALAEAVKQQLRTTRDARLEALNRALDEAGLPATPGTATETDTEIAVTVMVPAGEEARIEAALTHMAPAHTADVSADMRGPMPAVSFTAVRLERTDPQELTRAWRTLSLPAEADSNTLHRQWRAMAAAHHPDRFPGQSTASTAFTTITQAYQTLRPLLRADPKTLASLLHHEGTRLLFPTQTATPSMEKAA